MKYLIKNASISIGGNTLIEDINFEINDNNHVGLVGKNGCGKTTFLKCLIDSSLFEEGVEDVPLEIKKIGNFTIGYQSQVVFNNEKNTLLEELESSFAEIKNLQKKIAALEKKMDSDTSLKTLEEYTTTLERFKVLGGYSYQKEYEVMLSKFGFGEDDKQRAISSFSGGEKAKLAFIKLLLSKPDLLLLDEPTNHLDIKTIIWLEEYLKSYKGAFIVVSHDRMFLNNTVNIIYDIAGGVMTRYTGSFTSFEKQKKLNYEKALKDYEIQEKEIAKLNELYLKYRFKPTKAGLAMSRLKRLEKIEKIEKPARIAAKSFKANLKNIAPSGKMVMTLKNLSFGYDHELGHLNLEVLKGDKIAIIGANGTGKSTLLKTLNGKLKPLAGSVTLGYHVTPGYFDQNIALNEHNTILKEFMDYHPDLLEKEARSALGAFLFTGEDTAKKISVLSGGEKVRLSLCNILYNKPNLLFLDEPTNHLDIDGKTRLEEILSAYEGTLIFVSHDRYFIKKLATKLIVFEQNSCTYYPYGYDEYLEKSKPNNESAKPKINKKSKISPKAPNNNATKELKKLEEKIKKQEDKIKEINNQFFLPEVYEDYDKAHSLENLLQEEKKILEDLYAKWEEISGL